MKWIVGNWKMNFKAEEAERFCKNLNKTKNLITVPPTLYLGYLSLKYKDKHIFGSQDITVVNSNKGRFTVKLALKC